MSNYKANKPKPSEDLESIAEHLAGQPEKLDRGLLGEYAYWSWRCLLWTLGLVLLLSIASGDPPVQYLMKISAPKWAIFILTPLLIGPLVFIGWSYIWMWGQDLLERLRQ